MPTQIQFRRGTTAQNNSFSGAAGEITVNTSNNTIRIHDGSTAGGFELAKRGNVSLLTTGTSLELASVISDETGTGNLVFSTSPVFTTPNLGTPSAVNLTNATHLPVLTGIDGLGTGVAIFLAASPVSSSLATLITDETGSGNLVFSTSPVLVTPALGAASGASVMLTANIGAAAGNISGNFTAANFQSTGNVNIAAGLVTGNFTAGNFQSTGNVNAASALFTGSVTGGTIQTAGNVNAAAMRITGAASIGGNLSVTGNIDVAGALVTYSSNTLSVADSIIFLATNNTGDVLDLGLVGRFSGATTQYTGLVRDASDGVWKLFANVAASPTNSIDFTPATYSSILVGSLAASSGSFTGNVTGAWVGNVIATTYGGTGNSSGYASGGANSAASSTVTDDTTTNATHYIKLAAVSTGNAATRISTTKLFFNPSTGLLTSTDYNSSSDKRLKENIKTIEGALDKINALRGVVFDWKEGSDKGMGLIAQEVAEILPDVVTTDDNGYMGIKYTNIIGVLVEAIKDQQQQINILKKQIEIL